ncbi:unnamed protein product [Urochloa humidicola]
MDVTTRIAQQSEGFTYRGDAIGCWPSRGPDTSPMTNLRLGVLDTSGVRGKGWHFNLRDRKYATGHRTNTRHRVRLLKGHRQGPRRLWGMRSKTLVSSS